MNRRAKRVVFLLASRLAIVMLLVLSRETAVNAQSASDSEFQLEQWVEAALEQSGITVLVSRQSPLPLQQMKLPEGVTETRWAEALVAGLSEFEKPEQRLACLKILVERIPVTSASHLMSISADPSLDVEIRVAALHVAGVLRVPAWIEPLLTLVNDEHPAVRAAAIDAVGMTRAVNYSLDKGDHFVMVRGPVRINCTPTISLANLIRLGVTRGDFGDLTNEVVIDPKSKLPHGTARISDESLARARGAINQAMISAVDPAERAAASRAMVGWTTDKAHLRVAEWGVWIDSDGQLKLVKSVLEEIPEFVHRTTKRVSGLQDQVNQIMIITKPVIHITVNQPMAVDVKAWIHQGQPWFAFPRPTDFTLQIGGGINDTPFSDKSLEEAALLVKAVDPDGSPTVTGLRDGYPWIDPPNTLFGGISGGMGSQNNIQAIGLNWQSLIVSPQRLDWMQLPQVDASFRWWADLREVQSSWIGSGDAAGNESERFLYYDGPTVLPSPLSVSETESTVTFQYRTRHGQSAPVPGLLVEVDSSGRCRALEIKDINTGGIDRTDSVKAQWPLQDDQVIDAFAKLVGGDQGLNSEEAKGIISSWKGHFFETPGTRLIARITRNDYDAMCPIEIRPEPTELARVGLVVRELK